MENIKDAVVAACTLSAGLSLISCIVAGTRFRKSIRFISEVIMILVISSAFLSALKTGSYSEVLNNISFDENELSEDYNELLCRETEDIIERKLLAELSVTGAEYSVIKPQVHISDTGCIIIDSVRIESSQPDAVSAAIRSVLGEETEVLYGTAQTSS